MQFQALLDGLERETAGVSREIAPGDRMYKAGPDYYFFAGNVAMRLIRLAMLEARRTKVASVLDFPCGHGRVLRFLRAEFPGARLTACDIDEEALGFCATHFEVVPVSGREDPRDLEIDDRFDLIWCGSLLTHVDAPRWDHFLEFFESVLEPDGLLLFTTHGAYIARQLRNPEGTVAFPMDRRGPLLDAYERTGFGYMNYPNWDNYGLSLTTPAWVCSRVQERAGLSVLNYTEYSRAGLSGWVGQDVMTCIKSVSAA
jgi:SAM-dependent methyltransferase